MIYIKELLPNPVGPDKEGEWIKIINRSEEQVSLNGWVIKDESGKQFKISNKILKPKEEAVFKYQETKLALNNNGDTVTIFNSSGEMVHSLSYSDSQEGEVVVHQAFREEVKTENLNAAILPINQGSVIIESANFTPLVIGLSLALILAMISGVFFKKLS